ncbi:hypothetical protein RHMOL_Rhmol11G0079700 [Rhododendron molle]|uniref:Uncharacterized protein n=1 Tax=Rhododendron molle TaxID=49168 RepID=A0ACC0LQT6_RHOML|nr:hypothetical protein RHMOL_Rhmol11G0079700 [Rhododendron molle]
MHVAFWFMELSFAVANFFHGVVHMNLLYLLVIIAILEELLAFCSRSLMASFSRVVLHQMEEPMRVHGLGAQFNKLGMIFFFERKRGK